MSVLGEVFGLDSGAIVRLFIAVPTLYAVLILFIRLSGKRTTSQMNNFDWIVTVALGSLIATGILSNSATVTTVIIAIALLLTLQFCVTWLTMRSVAARNLVKPPPRLLLYNGEFLRRDMKIERVSELEILAAIRAAGHHELEDVLAVVLETDASLSVLPYRREKRSHYPVLRDVAVATPDVRPQTAGADSDRTRRGPAHPAR